MIREGTYGDRADPAHHNPTPDYYSRFSITMTRRKNPNTVLREAEIQQAPEGIESGLHNGGHMKCIILYGHVI